MVILANFADEDEEMTKRTQRILVLILIVCAAIFALLQLRCFPKKSSSHVRSKIRRSHIHHPGKQAQSSPVQIIGWDYEPDERVESRLTKDAVKYVLMVPHKLNSELKSYGVTRMTVRDQQALLNLTKFLDTHAEYDGATGITTQRQGVGFDATKESLERSSCRFLVKNWTIIIQNSGQLHQDTSEFSRSGWYQECNIAEGAFVLRREVFLSLRWRAECGSMSHLDFFVRSNEALRIAKLSDCFFSSELTYTDRGILEGTRDFIDYSTLGQLHNILRIVRPDKIEWTKCADDKQFCPEAPLSSRSNTSAATDGFPICCDVVMDDILSATVDAMNKIGIDYRVVYGTLLGAVRSQALIPYSDDVDVAIHKADNDRYDSFRLMQSILGPRYYVAWKTNPPTSRVYPHFAPTVKTDTRRLFKGKVSLEREALFESKILKEIEKLLPVKNILLEQRYVDLYPSPESWFEKGTEVTINNRRYLGVSDNVNNFLRDLYGDDYMEKIPEIHSKTTLQTN